MKKLKNRLVFFNGKFVEEKHAKLSIYDSALMFGDMVFEMTRSFNKKQFFDISWIWELGPTSKKQFFN